MNIATVAGLVEANGGRLYLVGGGVRDKLMNHSPADHDYCVEGLTADQFTAIFPDAFVAGQSFPVFRMAVDGETCEFALARTERKVGTGHTAFEMFTDPLVTIEQDLLRRDLTINAMAIHVSSGELVDPYGGRSDIESSTLRAVSCAFREDPLRVYRTARFAAQLSFHIDPSTQHMMTDMQSELGSLSPERVFEELRKALHSVKPSLFFRALSEAKVLHVHFPELARLQGVPQPKKYHPEGDAWEHSLQVLDAAAQLTDAEETRFAALVHDVGKALTPADRWPSHRGHEALGVPATEQLCQRLKVPTLWTQAARFATEHHMKIHTLHLMSPEDVVDLLQAASRNPLGVDGFAVIGLSDIRGRNAPTAKNANAEQMLDMWNRLSGITGKSVMGSHTPSGPEFGLLLRTARAKEVEAWRKQHV